MNKVSVYTGGKVVLGGRAAIELETRVGLQNSTVAFTLLVPLGTGANGFRNLLEEGSEANDYEL